MIKKYKEYLKEVAGYLNAGPYEDDERDAVGVNPILFIAKKKGKPHDQITHLNCAGKSLDSLEGIEGLINLEKLWCFDNNLTNLNEIQNLMKLEYLDCSNNDLTDLNGIENLTNLKYIFCSKNNLTNLNEIQNLINIKGLWCFNNNFSKDYKEYIKDYCKNKKIQLGI
jgi:Leucine-rich repeat (LRR) protein